MPAKKAYSLLELLLVLAIASILVMMSVRFFGLIGSNERINKTLTDMKTIRQAAAEWALGQSDYSSITMAALNTAGLLPSSIGTGVGKNAWGGNYTVGPGASASQLTITLTRLGATASAMPASACNNLKNNLQSQAISLAPANCGQTAVYDFSASFG